MPDASTLTEAYQNYYTHTPDGAISKLRRLYLLARNSYIKQRFGYPLTNDSWWVKAIGTLMALPPHRRIGMDAMAMWLPWHPNGTLLEIGCGNGDRLALFKKLGWKVCGIEPDAEAAYIGRARGLDIRLDALQNLPTDSFDAVVMSHVIEHVPDPQETIRECLRLLRPQGMLIMLTPNTDSFGHRWFGRNWLHLDPPRHMHLFNCHNLSKLCLDAGFSIVRCATTPRDANWTLGASLTLQQGNPYVIGQLSLTTRCLGLCLFYFEWLALFVSSERGEEVIVAAQAPGNISDYQA
jgi:SAM-dependent methyltransferase